MRKKLDGKWINFLVMFLFLISMAACGGGSSGGVTEKHEASGSITSAGGTIEVTDAASAIKGAKVIIPADSVDAGENVTVNIDSSGTLPGTAPAGVTPMSKIVLLTKDSTSKFKNAVTVTIPYDPVSGNVPAVFYWDETLKKYISVGVKDIDPVNKTITFTTVHFTKFVALGFDPISTLSTINVDTKFVPNADGFFHPNFGAYDSPGGSCLGMAAYSGWNYSINGSGLYNKYRQGDPAKWQDDVIVRELISRAFIASSQYWAKMWFQTDQKLGTDVTGALLIATMKITGAPQIFLFRGANFGHAVLVYGYDATKKQFLIYDNNFPGENVTVEWDSTKATGGFSNYSKAAAYDPITKYGFEAFSSAFDITEFNTLWAGIEGGWPSSKFQTISVTAPALTNDEATITTAPDVKNPLKVTGTVSGGIANAKYLVVQLNGTKAQGTSGVLITLGAGGTFSFNINSLPLATNSIMLMSTDDAKDATRYTPNAYAGFKQFTIKVKGVNFFTNLGFETGDFTAWKSEQHTWSDPTQIIPSPKSAIVGVGADPISGGDMVYKGAHAARVNNSDSSYHISTVSQSATVPAGVANPELRFYWSAVLEDPDHPPEYQAYVDVLVTDDTAGVTLNHEHFYSYDPSYSGWETFTYFGSTWRRIPWQMKIISLSSAQAGHIITLKVTGADCGYGAHGGYVYVDGDE